MFLPLTGVHTMILSQINLRIVVLITIILSISRLAHGGNINSQIRNLQFGIKMWQANVNDECARSYPEDLWKCYIGYRAQHHIKSKHFLITYYLYGTKIIDLSLTVFGKFWPE